MKRFGALKPAAFPSLRWSLFGGEALHESLASSWAAAAPESVVENLYGPTEGTVECFHYRWDRVHSPSVCERGITPLGFINPAMTSLVVDEDLSEVDPGQVGELLISGDQLTDGYWRDPERTQQSFLIPPGSSRIHFRTGDRVRRPLDSSTPMKYLGRIDYQVQIRGHRVELGEIEAAARGLYGIDGVVAVAWPPRDDGTAEGIELFLESHELEAREVITALSGQLPEYMIPREVHILPHLPRSAHGKFDRAALVSLLKENR
jgi:acyl-CoA synthetase (AMP-forming)/AMP-acid ligase II